MQWSDLMGMECLLAQFKTEVDFQWLSMCSSLASGNHVLMFFWRLNLSLFSVLAVRGGCMAMLKPISIFHCPGPTVIGLGMGICKTQESILATFTKSIKNKMQSVGLLREEDVHRKALGAILVPCWKIQVWVSPGTERESPDDTEPLYLVVPKALFCYMNQYILAFYFFRPLEVRFLGNLKSSD